MNSDSDNGKQEAGAEQDAGAEEQASELTQAREESARLRDQLLRAAAELDNARKRSRREIAEGRTSERERVVKELLPVFDNLERATSHLESATEPAAIAQGLDMVLEQFQSALERLGITRIPTVGSEFDPAIHEALHEAESAELPASHILAEVEPGYSIGDRLLRAAKVIVSKGASERLPKTG